MSPDPWQRKVMASTARQQILCVSRQAGKSSVVAHKATHDLLYEPGAFVVCLAPSFRQSRELFRRIMHAFRQLGRPVPAERENTLELELANGARCVALPGASETIRGYSGATRLLIDEAGSVPDEVYLTVRPFLATTNGILQATGTPRGRRGWFYEAWENGGPAWERTKVKCWDCPRLSREFLEREREEMGQRWFSQEYECEFLDILDGLFTTEQIERAITSDVGLFFPGGIQ